MSKSFKLYYDLMSQPARALWLSLRLGKTPFEDCPVALRKREQLCEDFKKINRFQKVPCIVDGDFHLGETIAIFRYLSERGSLSESLFPKEMRQRARIDEFLEWQHLTLRYGVSSYFVHMWLLPANGAAPAPTAAKEQELRKTMEANLQLLEDLWLKNSDYLANNSLSVADLMGASEIEQLRLTKYNVADKYPKISEWMERVRNATNPHYDEAHKFIYKISKAVPKN